MLDMIDSFSFDDVSLVPKFSAIKSRSEIDLSVELSKGVKLKLPIIPANMKTILNIEAAFEFYKLGTMAIMHRFATMEQQIFWLKSAKEWKNGLNYVGFSVGVQAQDYKNVDTFAKLGAKIICIDIAHGHSQMCIDMTKYIAEKYPHIFLISGNVCTADGTIALWSAGADAVKENVGAGSICTTRIMTGNGVGQLSAIVAAHSAREETEKRLGKKLFIISDGGANASGQLVKGLCFSDLVMTGNLFAGAEECPGEIKTIDGKKYKSYAGSSTHKSSHIEGVEALVLAKPSIANIMQTLCEGIRSGCSYQGVNDLKELRRDPQFVRITHATLKESGAHDVAMVVK